MRAKSLIGNGTQKQHRREGHQTRQSKPNKQVQQRKTHKGKKQVVNPRGCPQLSFRVRRIGQNRTTENVKRTKGKIKTNKQNQQNKQSN